MGKCKQKDHKWNEHTVRAINGKYTGLPFSWKCVICGTLGMLHGRKKRSKILPVTEEEFLKACEKTKKEKGSICEI